MNVWQPIQFAPKDGTLIDLWFNGRRWTDCFWGRPYHSCGEMGEYCDSHPDRDDWCASDGFTGYLNEGHPKMHPTAFMKIPEPPPKP